MRTTKPRVVKNGTAKTPGSAWVVEGLRDQMGKRVRRFFASRDLGTEWLRSRRTELITQGRAALDLTDAQRVDAVRALEILGPLGSSLTLAAQTFKERAALLNRTVTIAELRNELLEAKKADGGSVRYLADLRVRLAQFGRTFDARPVATIETAEIDDFLRGLPLSAGSRVNYRKILLTAFQFAISRGYAKENPVAGTAKVKAITTPGILTPEELRAFLTVADKRIVVSVALSAFAGLRDAEVARLRWSDINLTEGHIMIGATVAKTASRRVIPILPALRAWISPLAGNAGPVRPSSRTTYLLLQQAKRDAVAKLEEKGLPCDGVRNWPHNALRHSFVSYRLAAVGNSHTVAEEAGHSPQVLKKHYLKLVTPAQAEKWFSILPGVLTTRY